MPAAESSLTSLSEASEMMVEAVAQHLRRTSLGLGSWLKLIRDVLIRAECR